MKIYSNRYTTTYLTAIIAILIMSISVIAPVTVEDTTTIATVNVNEFLSITLTGSVDFESVNENTVDNPDKEPLVVTVEPETNIVGIKVKTEADTDFFSGPAVDTLAIGNMKWNGTAYTTSPVDVCTGLSATGISVCEIDHTLTIPSILTAGTYTVSITITATNA